MYIFEITGDLEEKLKGLMEDATKKIRKQVNKELVEALIDASWEDVDGWLAGLDDETRRSALGQLLHILNRANEAGYIDIVFEQTDWEIEEDEDERCSTFDEARTRSIEGDSDMVDDVLSIRPKLESKRRGKQRSIAIVLEPE